MIRLKTKNLFHSVPGAVALGTIVCILTLLILTVAITYLVHGQLLHEDSVRLAAEASIAIASFIGVLAATTGMRSHITIQCVATAVVSYLCLLLGGVLIFGSGFEGLGTGAIMVAIGSAVAFLVNILPKNRNRKGKYKYRFR